MQQKGYLMIRCKDRRYKLRFNLTTVVSISIQTVTKIMLIQYDVKASSNGVTGDSLNSNHYRFSYVVAI